MTQAARAATVGELALLRTPGDWTRAFLAIYKPNVIYTAVLDDVPVSNDMVGEITFVSGAGTLADVKAEMTLWVGSTATAKDLGTCRIRKAPIAGTIYIGHTSEIDWAGAATVYLTVMDNAVLSKKPVLIDAGVIKMDGEHAYSDQHENFDPVPVMSCHAVGTLAAGELALQWDASHSWVFDSTIASYLWEAPESLSIDDNTSAAPIITYDSAGNHPVYCTVTAANGKSATGIQFAFRFDADNLPHTGEIQSPSADYDNGGWQFKARMFAGADPTEIIEGALCVLFADDYYGATKQSIGQLADRENIICWGWIAGKEEIEWDAEAGSVEFSVYGPHYWLDKIHINPLKLTMMTGETMTWDLMPSLTVDRYLWHALHWRSNATSLLNITLTDDARLSPTLEAEGSLWSQINDVAWRKIFGRVGCDRYGRLFAVIDPQCVPEADRAWSTVMTITKKDWRDRVNVKRITERRIAMLNTSGWIVDTSAAVSTVYSLSVGHIAAQLGDSVIIDQLLADSQDQLNELTGLYVGWKNCEYDFEFDLAQNNRLIDLYPNQFLAVTLAAGDTPRGVAYNGNLIPRSISLNVDPDTGAWSTLVTCEAETFAELAINGDIPASTGIDSFDMSFPPIDIPSLPPDFPIDLPPNVENLNHPKVVVIASSKGVLYTRNFDETSPTWQYMNNGLPEIDRADIHNLVITPAGALYLHIATGNYVYRASGLGGAWIRIASASDFLNQGINAIGVNPTLPDTIAIVGQGAAVSIAGIFKLAASGTLSAGLGATYFRNELGCVVFSNGKWIAFGSHYGIFNTAWVTRYSASGTVEYEDTNETAGGQDAAERYAQAPGYGDTVYQWDESGAGGFNVVTGGGETPTRSTVISISKNGQGAAFAPPAVYGMGADQNVFIVPYKTTDSGATWSSVAATMPVGTDIWENCRDNNRWIAGGGTAIRLTTDQGATYSDKSGNLGYIAPLIDITNIRFIE